MKIVFALTSIAALLSVQSSFAAKDDYTQRLIWRTMEAKRAQVMQVPQVRPLAMFKFHPLSLAK